MKWELINIFHIVPFQIRIKCDLTLHMENEDNLQLNIALLNEILTVRHSMI
jgi:hypothetical protein